MLSPDGQLKQMLAIKDIDHVFVIQLPLHAAQLLTLIIRYSYDVLSFKNHTSIRSVSVTFLGYHCLADPIVYMCQLFQFIVLI